MLIGLCFMYTNVKILIFIGITPYVTPSLCYFLVTSLKNNKKCIYFVEIWSQYYKVNNVAIEQAFDVIT